MIHPKKEDGSAKRKLFFEQAEAFQKFFINPTAFRIRIHSFLRTAEAGIKLFKSNSIHSVCRADCGTKPGGIGNGNSFKFRLKNIGKNC